MSRINDLNWPTKNAVVIRLPYKGLDNAETGCKWKDAYLKFVENQRFPTGRKGVRHLRDLAAITALKGLPDLEQLPWTIATQLWDIATKSATLSFQNWKVLSKLLRKGVGRHESNGLRTTGSLSLALFRHDLAICEPSPRLLDYLPPLCSPTFEFITALSITAEFPISDLVKLYEIKNLGILEIINPKANSTDPGECRNEVSDRLVRTWAEKARDGAHFRALRIIRLWYFKGITSGSLQYVDSFPSLAIYDVRGFGFRSLKCDQVPLGWTHMRGSDVLSILRAACQQTTDEYATAKKTPHERLPRPDCRFVWDEATVNLVERGESMQGRLLRAQSDDRLQSIMSEATDPQIGGKDLRDMPCVIYRDLIRNRPDADWYEWIEIKWRTFWQSCLVAKSGCKNDFERASHAAFARVGELRADADLIWAGVEGLDKAMFAGDDLVSPAPMACVQLGQCCEQPSHPVDQLSCGYDSGGDRLFFYKLGWTPPAAQDGERDKDHSRRGLARRSRSLRKVQGKDLGSVLSEYSF